MKCMDLPKTGRAIDVPNPGGLDALLMIEQSVPQPGPGQVLIEVHAAGVNRADVKQRAGDYPMPEDASSVPGLEVAGRVSAVGSNVSRWKVGERICALVVSGGYAEYCIAPEVQCLPIPEGLDYVQAAALPETVFTVWTALFEQAGLKAGESVLVHGGASGIGTTAIQMATALGATVYATAGSDERCQLCQELGAEAGINYRKDDFVARILALTGGQGVDVVLDMVGGSYASRNLQVLARFGRICFIAGDESQDAVFTVREIMLKRAVITGSTLRHRSIEDKGRVAELIVATIWPLVKSGKIRPVISHRIPLAQVRDAHKALEDGSAAGKVILMVR